MKNLFDYATKELSQDAFLRWIFENYEDAELGELAYALLKEFCKLSDDETITKLETWSQWNKVDISVWFETDKRSKMALFIEDKTFSCEHNQLIEYDKHIDAINDRICHKIFYKTNSVNETDSAGIHKAKAESKSGWEIYDIDKILPIFKKFKSINNLIVAQYIEYIERIAGAINNVEKPSKSENNIDLLSWQSYFNKVIAAINSDTRYRCGAWKAGQYPYMCLVITKTYAGDKSVPYLEIRSRDCYNDKFMARILCYGVPDEDLQKYQQTLIDNVKSNSEFICKGLVTSHKGKRIFPKQVGVSKDGLTASSDEKFIELTRKYIEQYLNVMKDWQ